MTENIIKHDYEPQMSGVDRVSVIAVCVLIGVLAIGFIGNGSAGLFLDLPSIALVIGGTIGATLLQYSISEFRHCYRTAIGCLRHPATSPYERVQLLVTLAHTAREHGLLALEHVASRTDDVFLRTGLELAADGDRLRDLRPLLENEMARTEEQMEHAASILYSMGSYAPAMGLIGTLIGLIQMLSALQEPARVGPAMSLALVSTLYGALAANLFFLPLAGKLRSRNDHETLIRRITLEGVTGLAVLESPILLSQRLRTFISGSSYEH